MNALLAVILPLLIAYAPTLAWCVERWNAPTQYFAHGWLVPLVAAVVVWTRRRQWRTAPAIADRAAVWLLAPGLLLHAFGLLLMVDSWSAASLVFTVPGAVWLCYGRARLRGLWPVVWLVLFFVPMPIFVEGRLAFSLKEIAVAQGANLANLAGADVTRAGDSLLPRGMAQGLYVADACGGLRSLLSMTMLAWCLAFFTGPAAWQRRVLMLLAAAPIAVLANVVRIASICLAARWFGVPFAEGTGHTLANGAEWLADIVALFALDVLARRRWARTATAVPPPALPDPRPRPGLAAFAVIAWLAAGPLLWLGVHRPFTAGQDRAAGLPGIVASWTAVPRLPADEERFQRNLPRWWELLGTRDFVWRSYRDAADRRVHLVGLFHDTNWKSVHPPRICIEGSNMDIERDEVAPAPWLGDGASVGRIVARSRANGRRYVTLAVFGTRSWASGSYGEFFWYHLPKALLRQNESGFLLRVESAIGRDGDAAAEARCREFLTALVPAARELLR